MKNYKKGLLAAMILSAMSLMAAEDKTIYVTNLSSMKYFSFLASFGKLAYLDLSNKPL